jgi:hypothetical protein
VKKIRGGALCAMAAKENAHIRTTYVISFLRSNKFLFMNILLFFKLVYFRFRGVLMVLAPPQ